MTERKIHLIGRIDQIVRDYFEETNIEGEIPAKEFMPLFIKKGIFKTNHRDGLSIRKVLRELDSLNKFYLLNNLCVKRNSKTTNWYFKNKKSKK